MKLTPREFVQVLSEALYVFSDGQPVNSKDLLDYIEAEISFIKQKRKDAE